jgi:hypothetical protein
VPIGIMTASSTARSSTSAWSNGDGRLTLEEFVNARFRDFEAAETNRDGALTFEEIQVYSSRR